MSVEAIAWVLNHAPVSSPVSKLVLVALANHARPDGSAAFPSVGTICRYTCLSERSVRQHLDSLEAKGVIERCDPSIVAAHIKRSDRRPIGYNILLREVQEMHLVEQRGAGDAANGVHLVQERGAGDAPETYMNRPMNTPRYLQAVECADFFQEALRNSTPDGVATATKNGEWVKDMMRLLDKGANAALIKVVVQRAFEDAFWRRNIRTPAGLVKHWDRLAVDKAPQVVKHRPMDGRMDSAKTTIKLYATALGKTDEEILEFINGYGENTEELMAFWEQVKNK